MIPDFGRHEQDFAQVSTKAIDHPVQQKQQTALGPRDHGLADRVVELLKIRVLPALRLQQAIGEIQF